jgi:hypothetical protein
MMDCEEQENPWEIEHKENFSSTYQYISAVKLLTYITEFPICNLCLETAIRMILLSPQKNPTAVKRNTIRPLHP